MQREHSRNNLFMIVTRLKVILEAIPNSAGYLKKDCETVFNLMSKVEKQYQTIRRRLIQDEENANV
jgi:hypothetical protein